MKKNIFLFLAFTMMLQNIVYAKKFNAKVLDEISKKPISNALILIDGIDSVRTNQFGDFEYIAKKDILHILISKENYKNYHLDIDLNKISDKIIISLHPLEFHLDEVYISDNKLHNPFESAYKYKKDIKEINSSSALSTGELIGDMKGVELRTMGAATARPVFRGLGSDRLKINLNGLNNFDLSSASPDHNVAIDQLSVNEAEIMRGPATLKYSSSSSAGVINLQSNEIPFSLSENQVAEIKNFYNSNNNGYLSYWEHQANIYDIVNSKISFSKNYGNNLKTPNKYLQNSKINSDNYSIGLGKTLKNIEFGVNYNYYENNYGIPPAGDSHHQEGVDIEMFKKDFKSTLNYHLHSKYIQDIKINYLYNYLQHIEFESEDEIGAKYDLNNHLVRLDFVGKSILNSDKSDFGIIFNKNNYKAGGEVKTPNVEDFSFSSYFIQRYDFNKYLIEFALRNEIKNYTPIRNENVPEDVKLINRKYIINSLSTAQYFKLSDKNLIGLLLSYDERVPTLEELYSMGQHLASYSYEIGNQNINKENSLNIELIFQNKYSLNEFQLNSNINIFNYYFFNYITPRNTGKIDILETQLPIYENQFIKANIFGFENELILKYKNLEIKNTTQASYGTNINDNMPLPMISPLKNILSLTYSNEKYSISIINESATKQSRIDKYETITNGYSILNFKSSYYFYLFGTQNQLVFNVKNIFNTYYKNHLSRIKNLMPESGTNISIGLNNYL